MLRKVGRVNYSVKRIRLRSAGFWFHWWTPVWSEGRGPYISIGLGVIALYRGY
jgi:hypothetical protein